MRALLWTGLVVLIIGGGAALAHTGATGIVKERMEAMMDVAAGMKAIGAMIKGETAFDAGAVAETANRLAGHASRMERLFPEGTNAAPSEARAEIWADWDRFVGISEQMNARAMALTKAAAAAKDAQDIRDAFSGLGATCKDCHAAFRQKK
ncbi:cytochrome c [uncultured Hoeflea sp.]|uniref:c-type cytochrome n=1 Tax=uncultured Hoeflea sp. TaxID=538666 RepID=UPI002604CC9F|nr:cytochrome c [uncultured Hoeflea sp.]